MLSWERKEERREPGEWRDGKNAADRGNIMCKGPEVGRHRDHWRRESRCCWSIIVVQDETREGGGA